MIEPFGFFKATPFGWEDCAETDEGSVALYEASTIEDARREGEDRVIDKLLAAQANENAARAMCDDLRRQLSAAQAHKFFCITELRRADELMLSECGLSVVDKQIFDLTESKALDSVIEAEKKEEREACAKVCEEQAYKSGGQDWYVSGAIDCAEAIRARSDK